MKEHEVSVVLSLGSYEIYQAASFLEFYFYTDNDK